MATKVSVDRKQLFTTYTVNIPQLVGLTKGQEIIESSVEGEMLTIEIMETL